MSLKILLFNFKWKSYCPSLYSRNVSKIIYSFFVLEYATSLRIKLILKMRKRRLIVHLLVTNILIKIMIIIMSRMKLWDLMKKMQTSRCIGIVIVVPINIALVLCYLRLHYLMIILIMMWIFSIQTSFQSTLE